MSPTVRCSELDRLLSCPGSRTLAERVKAPDRDDGVEGSVLHWLIAKELVGSMGAMGLTTAPWRPPGWKLAAFSAWIVGFCVREVRQNTPEGWSLEVEVPMAYSFDRFNLSGHLDRLSVNSDGTEAIFDDYKTGFDPVDPADLNEQGLGYIVLVKRAYPGMKKITGRFIQPRNNEDDGFPRVSSVVVEGDDLDHCVKGLENRVNAALNRSMELETGRKQCRWCPAQVACATTPGLALYEETNLMKITLTEELLARVAAEPNDAQLGDLVITGKTLEKPIDAATELLKKRLDTNPEIVAGCGVRISRKIVGGAYKVIDPVRLFSTLRGLLKDEQLAPALGYPTGKMKDAFAEHMNIPKAGKAAVTAESVFQAKCGPCVEQTMVSRLIFS